MNIEEKILLLIKKIFFIVGIFFIFIIGFGMIIFIHNKILEIVKDETEFMAESIEDGVVGGYKKIETGVVEGFGKVTDKCVEVLFAKDGESVEDAKKRLSGDKE